MAGTARQSHEQQVHFLRKRVNYNDAGVATGVLVGTLPAGALLGFSCEIDVATAFNGGTNALSVGLTPTGQEVATPAVTLVTATGTKRLTTQDALGPMAADTDVWASFVQTGGAATAGIAYILIPYYPNIDL